MIHSHKGAEPLTMRLEGRVSLDVIRPIARIRRDPGARCHVRTLSIVLVFLGATLSTATAQESIETRCRAVAGSVNPNASDFYLICVDALVDRRDVATLHCEQPAANCSRQGDLLDAGRSFVVVVWTTPGVVAADAHLSGTAGFSWIHQPAGIPAKGGEVQHVAYFSPRKPGSVALTVTVHMTAGGPFTVKREYTIRASYRVAIRFGLGISWAPWARKVGIRTAADGQRYVAVVSGADDGLVDNELVAGISFFPCTKIKEGSLEAAFAIGVRLGVVKLGSGNDWFQSVMVGPEFAIGPDLSIGIFGGLRRIALPETGYEPGKLVPSDSIPTHIGVTPAFGVALNFTPGFLKFFGVTL